MPSIKYAKILEDQPCVLFHPQSIAIALAYFSIGFTTAFIYNPLNVYLVKGLDADPQVQNAIRILRTLPWSLKLVYGFISDAFPIFGLHRKPYLVIGALLNSVAFFVYSASGANDFVFLGICVLIGKIGLIMMDVMVDTMVVERSRYEQTERRGQLQASCQATRYAGSLMGAIAGTLLYNKVEWGWGLTFHEVSFVIGFVPFALVMPWLMQLKEQYQGVTANESPPPTCSPLELSSSLSLSPMDSNSNSRDYRDFTPSPYPSPSPVIDVVVVGEGKDRDSTPVPYGYQSSAAAAAAQLQVPVPQQLQSSSLSCQSYQSHRPYRERLYSPILVSPLTLHGTTSTQSQSQSHHVHIQQHPHVVHLELADADLTYVTQDLSPETGIDRPRPLLTDPDAVPVPQPEGPLVVVVADDGVMTVRDHLRQIWLTAQLNTVWKPMAFIYFFNVLQIPNVAWLSYLQLTLDFKPFALGVIGTMGSFMLIIGVLAYKKIFFKSSWRSIFITTALLTTVFNLLQLTLIFQINIKYLHLSNYLFCFGDDVITQFIRGINLLPVCVMCMRLCPDGSEGTAYAMLTTFENVASLSASALGNHLAKIWDVSNSALRAKNVDGLWRLTVLVSVLSILPISLVRLLPRNAQHQDERDIKKKRSKICGVIFLSVLFGNVLWNVVAAIGSLMEAY
eukprot:gene9278-19257_t